MMGAVVQRGAPRPAQAGARRGGSHMQQEYVQQLELHIAELESDLLHARVAFPVLGSPCHRPGSAGVRGATARALSTVDTPAMPRFNGAEPGHGVEPQSALTTAGDEAQGSKAATVEDEEEAASTTCARLMDGAKPATKMVPWADSTNPRFVDRTPEEVGAVDAALGVENSERRMERALSAASRSALQAPSQAAVGDPGARQDGAPEPEPGSAPEPEQGVPRRTRSRARTPMEQLKDENAQLTYTVAALEKRLAMKAITSRTKIEALQEKLRHLGMQLTAKKMHIKHSQHSLERASLQKSVHGSRRFHLLEESEQSVIQTLIFDCNNSKTKPLLYSFDPALRGKVHYTQRAELAPVISYMRAGQCQQVVDDFSRVYLAVKEEAPKQVESLGPEYTLSDSRNSTNSTSPPLNWVYNMQTKHYTFGLVKNILS